MKRLRFPLLGALLIVALGVCVLIVQAATLRRKDAALHAELTKSLTVLSANFRSGSEIPAQFTCRGEGSAPQVAWTGAPENTRSYALTMVDWDAPSSSLRLSHFNHWILYNIPPDVTAMASATADGALYQRGIVTGLNSANASGYAPPCPSLEQHEYSLRVYALDVAQVEPASKDREALMDAMKGHILGYGELIGRSTH